MVADLSAACARSGKFNVIDQNLNEDLLSTLPTQRQAGWHKKLGKLRINDKSPN
jgi:hypothetical protein